jgi:FkbM family methyltransferase
LYDDKKGKSMKFNGQWEQDKVLNELFGNKKNGVFVEIGAADPVEGNNSYFFEKEMGWQGVCIDARKSACDKLIQERSRVLNIAIGDAPGKVIFLEFGVLSGIAKFMSMHEFETIEKYTEDFTKVNAYWVELKTLSNVLDELQFTVVDILMLDTEGAELPILKASKNVLDVFKVLMAESNTVENRTLLKDFMAEQNFIHYKLIGMDDIFINKKYLNEFNI